MPTECNNVFPKAKALPKHRVVALLGAGWARTALRMGKGRFADAAETTTRTIDNGLTGNTLPEAHTVFNSLAADPTALDELLAEYGFRLAPLTPAACNDMATAANLSHAAGSLMEALSDGRRDHRETLELAEKFRPLIQSITAIILEADEIKTGRVALR